MKNRVKYGLLCGVLGIIRLLPLRYARGFGDGLGWFLNHVLKLRRDVIDDNLEQAFPDCDRETRREYANDCYRFFARAGVDWMKLDAVLRTETIKEEGWHHLEQFQGDGAIVVSGHFGYWELSAALVARRHDGFKVYADRQSNPYSDDLIRCHRENFDLQPVSGLSGVKELLSTLETGGIVGAMGDQREGNNFHYVPFFGRAVRTPRIIPFLARRTDSPVIPMSAYRKNGVIKFKLYEPLPTSLRSMGKEHEFDLLQEYHDWLENEVLKSPEQYFWLHKRWKDSRPVTTLKPRGRSEEDNLVPVGE